MAALCAPPSLAPVLPVLAGKTLYLQGDVVDPGASSGFALTNRLELTFGL